MFGLDRRIVQGAHPIAISPLKSECLRSCERRVSRACDVDYIGSMQGLQVSFTDLVREKPGKAENGCEKKSKTPSPKTNAIIASLSNANRSRVRATISCPYFLWPCPK